MRSSVSSRSRPALRSPGSTSTRTCRAPATSGIADATRNRGSRTSAGRTLGTPSVPRRRAARVPAGDLRAAGVRVRRELRGARLAREIWKDAQLADKLETRRGRPQAALQPRLLGRRRQYFAIALDQDGRQVDSLSSNNGHLLWSGIVDKSKARAVARHLLGPRLGLGGATRERRGSLQPDRVSHRNRLAVRQLVRRLGTAALRLKEEAAEIAAGILDRSGVLRRPAAEAFGGYPREQTKYPVQYPTACSPQAWSTGTPLLLLRTMLGLEPHGEHLIVDPALPSAIGHLELLDIPGRWGRIDAFGRGRVETGRKARGGR